LLFRGSRPQRVFALQGSDRLDRVCATDRLHACFGKAEVLDLACLNQFLHGASDVFDRRVRVNPVLIEQVDCVDLEPLERAFDRLLDMGAASVELPADDLRDIDAAASKIKVEGARYPEKLERMTGL